MRAVFNDMQDHSSPLDGETVQDRQKLFALLDIAPDREPFICELVGENGYKLTLGIGNAVGFVQHSPSSGDVPYLVAVGPERDKEQECAEFFAGDTATPVPLRYCLPFPMVKEIAGYFIETGERSPAVAWEEI
jgi:hypothetical protein